MITHQKCIICGELKPFSEFHKMTRRKYGYTSVCKRCRSLRDKLRTKKIKNKKTVDGFLQIFMSELEKSNEYND